MKTQKTAGTSIELALTPLCGPDDIITPLSPADEKARMVDGVVQARNYAGQDDEAAYRRSLVVKPGEHEGFYNHMPVSAAKALLPPDFWQKAFKFAIERHPYEKAVSWTYFGLGDGKPGPEQVRKKLDEMARWPGLDDSSRYMIDGQLAVDRVLRYESLAKEWPRLIAELGLPPGVELPRAKGQFRTDRTPAMMLLNPRQKQSIYRITRRTFDLMGYLR